MKYKKEGDYGGVLGYCVAWLFAFVVVAYFIYILYKLFSNACQ